MGRLRLSSEVLDLGRSIIAELDLDDRNDTLGRWLAHDIAARIAAAEAPGASEAERQACADAILKLWAHRRDWPDGTRPFEKLEPVLQVMDRLDPAGAGSSYFRPPAKTQTDGEAWLEAAQQIDRTARILIALCLKRAVASAEGDPDWAVTAAAAGLPAQEAEFLWIVTRTGEVAQESAEERRMAEVKGQLRALAAFRKSATTLGAALSAELADLKLVTPKRPRSTRSARAKLDAKGRKAIRNL